MPTEVNRFGYTLVHRGILITHADITDIEVIPYI